MIPGPRKDLPMTDVIQTSTPAAASEGLSLIARGVHKSFRAGDTTVVVLKGADLDVRPGEFVAIEGRSGSGKSTLLHVLAGLDAADSGKITAGGSEIGSLAAAVDGWRNRINGIWPFSYKFVQWILFPVDVLLGWLFNGILNSALVAVTAGPDRKLSNVRNREFGFVFQFYHLLPELNVLDNVLISSRIGRQRRGDQTPRDRAISLLDRFGLSHRLTHLPSQLSGGERQRVAIARALINRPQVLFADEPTGNLDYETGRQIMATMSQLHRDHAQTIVMVTHDRSLAREADRVLVLKDGKLEPAE
jgi:lipoprotein-releasing system ATP-binding protein